MAIQINTQQPDDLKNMPPEMAAEIEEVSKSRRDFMKVTGMAAMGAVIAGCTANERIVKPLVAQPEGIKLGVPYEYASTCQMCSANCGTVMKTRDGRPIKAEGNPQLPMNYSGLCASGQASLWNLYNPDRLHQPVAKDGSAKTWAEIDAAAKAAIGAGTVLLTGTISGAGARDVIARFCAKTGAKHVAYDAISAWTIAAAHRDTHGAAVIPRYRFDMADMIVSFGADFLGKWISPMEYSRQWAAKRDLRFGRKEMSRHIQLEARYSLTGANCDVRHRLPDSQRGAALVALAEALGANGKFGAAGKHGLAGGVIESLANELKASKGRSLVLAGNDSADNVKIQKLVNWINHTLENYGKTVDLRNHSQQKLGNDEALAQLLKDLEGGSVKTLIVYGVNPVYDLPDGDKFKELMAKAANTFAISDHADETASECAWIAADDDPNESWGDFEPQRGLHTLAQPLVRRLWDTRQGLHTLLVWGGLAAHGDKYYDVLKKFWETSVLVAGETFRSAVEMGFVDHRDSVVNNMPEMRDTGDMAGVGEVASGTGLEIIVYESYTVGEGRHANNGWLQELPDPLTRQSWTNGASICPATMAELGLEEGDLVEVTADIGGRKATCRVPVLRQPGATPGTVSIGLGYGRTKAGRIKHGLGVEADAVDEDTLAIGGRGYGFLGAGKAVFGSVSKVGKYHHLAKLQEHDSQEGRPLLKQTSFDLWKKNPANGNTHEIPPVALTVWPRWEYKGHKWGMVVDLNSCTGCGACVVACSVENNVPIVGKEEVWRRREMHWIRIDAYYEDAEHDGKLTNHENPEAGFQPMMCQHCENAPCETVCPVLATLHSEEGLNTQAYNRCIGTRYCANNCPYKVRRFNWFTYKYADLTMNLALNPDLTVRTQGVMEKCSMCAQRIYDGKRAAGLAGEKLRDGSIRTACQSSCPTNAIVFGDQNDPKSRVFELGKDARNYQVLAEINTRPAVTYLTKVRNRPSKPEEEALADRAIKRAAAKADTKHEGHDH